MPDRVEITCQRAESAAERAAHFAIRHQVFVVEQRVFEVTDLDEHDYDDATIHLVAHCGGAVAGSVRLFELEAGTGLWQGDRLAVLEPYRVRGVGAPLVQCAVATAATMGGHTMLAHIQVPNVGFFRRLGWSVDGEIEGYAGLPHQPMSIALPAIAEGAAVTAHFAAGVSARGR